MAPQTHPQATREPRDGQFGSRQALTRAIPAWAWILVGVMAASMLLVALSAR